ncbi:MAG TPA: nucleotidyltransferase family protein [Candidatus Nanoarchaeia archaeon]|nr:nucleotidyltransferase family protein [Candidatus Nanoarchaeia archaeon]
MEAIILAAGYATRLYPLTRDTPKPLLKVAGKPIIEHIIGKIEQIKNLGRVHIVTNDKFEGNFKSWLSSFETNIPISIYNDGTKTNEDRLGAIGDIQFALDSNQIDDDILVIAGDNLFELSLADAANYFKKKKSNVIVLYDVKSSELAKMYGVVETENGIVANFEEKPLAPKSTLVSTGIYFFTKKTVPLIKKYLLQGNSADKSGSFVEWLHKRDKIYTFSTDKKWFDIGDLEQLKLADRTYRQ